MISIAITILVLLHHQSGGPLQLPVPPKLPKQWSNIPKSRDRQYRVHHFRALLPVLSILGYWSIILGTSEVQVDCPWEPSILLQSYLD